MNPLFEQSILNATGATSISETEMIQSLWSGYGKIVRYALKGSERKSVVIKLVQLPDQTNHPRGWNTNLSHERKVLSYQVETHWYQYMSHLCTDECKVPECLAFESEGDEVLIVLEDLDEAGFPVRKGTVNWTEIESCLKWLAHFHAVFMNHSSDQLWPIGTYWHLDTRPEELEALTDQTLKKAAPKIDKILNECTYKTLVHGDAKLANFCFSEDGKTVAAVDFQYIGGGCGMKDVAYFIGSCLHEEDCERLEHRLLDVYFSSLKKAVEEYQSEVDYEALEIEWRKMFPVAWADFHRFLKGWSPGHWKINSYSEKITQSVIAQL